MEYALPEATIGAKWECVWNGIVKIKFVNLEYNLILIILHQ